MNVKTPLLSKGLQGQSPTSQSWSNESYVLIPKSSLRQTPKGTQRGPKEGLLRSRSPLRPKGLALLQGVASVSSVCKTPDLSKLSLRDATGPSDCGASDSKGEKSVLDRRFKQDVSTGPSFPVGCISDIFRRANAGDGSAAALADYITSVNPLIRSISNGSSLFEKHFYLSGNYATIDYGGGVYPGYVCNVTSSGPINYPAVGDNFYNRLGQQIRNLRAHIRGKTTIVHSNGLADGETWFGNPPPYVEYAVEHEPVAIAGAGSPTLYLAYDSAFPGSTYSPKIAPFTLYQLGSPALEAIPNPFARGIASVVKEWRVPNFDNRDGLKHSYGTAYNVTTSKWQTDPATYYWSHDIDLHGTVSEFLPGGTFPITNVYSWQMFPWSPSLYGAFAARTGVQSQSIYHSWTLDFVFQDVTTE